MRWEELEQQPCSLARTLSVVGDRWTLLVLRECFLGVRRFDEFEKRLGITRHVLAERLKKLVEAGVLSKQAYQQRPLREEYRLTEKGLDLKPTIMALTAWGDKWVRPGPVDFVAAETGDRVELELRTAGGQRIADMAAVRAKRRVVRPEEPRLAKRDVPAAGEVLLEVDRVRKVFGGLVAVNDVSFSIRAGDLVGLIGPNGAGKSTLIKLILGTLAPDSGSVRLGTNLQVAYFDQYRSTLREDWNALENVAEGRDFVEINGKRKHAIGYLQDFLFTPERARAPITRLSGGERNRLLLAKLFAQPSNLLVMDEPTNDLDVETLELLEELLGEYEGTLLLVSHDRDFLDNVVTSTLVMEGGGHVGEYVGGYSDWLRQAAPGLARSAAGSGNAAPTARNAAGPGQGASTASSGAPSKRKLSYKDARELEQLPVRIEQLEAELEALTSQMNDPSFFQREAATVAAHTARLGETQQALDAAYARWAELDG